MKKEDLLSLDIDNIAKARTSAGIGEERVWSGVTYVKTATGWRPKGKPRQKKEEEPTTKRNPKIEDSSSKKEKKEEDPNQRIKKVEEYASKAKDSQLEAAIQDPEQNPEIKDIAQAELDKREKETQKGDLETLKKQLEELKQILTKDLDQAKEKKDSGELKIIKKTGLVLGGHKIFIVMNADNTGYKTQGMKALKLESKEGESLADFKERIKQTWAAQQEGKETETKQEEKPSNKQNIDPQLHGQPQFQEPANKDTGIKEIKKTGIMVDGHKMFITMNADKTGYVSKGFGLNLESKEGESLVDFKNRVKQVLTDKLGGKEQKEEEKSTLPEEPKEETKEESEEDLERKEFLQEAKKIVDSYKESYPTTMENFDDSLIKNFTNKYQIRDFLSAYIGSNEDKARYFIGYRNDEIEYEEKDKVALENKVRSVIEESADKIEGVGKKEFKQLCEEAKEEALKLLFSDIRKATGVIMNGTTGESGYYTLGGEKESLKTEQNILAKQLGVQLALIEADREPVCFPTFCQNYKGEHYNCYDRALWPEESFEVGMDDDEEVIGKYIQEMESAKITKKEKKSLELYAGNSFYRFLTEYMIREGDISKMDEDAVSRGESKYGSVAKAEKVAKETIKDLNKYIDKNPIQENMVLSRRVNPLHNEEIFQQMALMKKGDVGTLKSVQSFAYTQKDMFGNFQITLLAKKGDPIANAQNEWEHEFISKQNTKFRVLETGFNSMVIEFIPENEE